MESKKLNAAPSWCYNYFETEKLLSMDSITEQETELLMDSDSVKPFMNFQRFFKYWNRKFKGDVTEKALILTLFDTKGKKFLKPVEVIKELKNIIDITSIKKIYFTENSAFLGLNFDTLQTKMHVYRNFRSIADACVYYVGMAEQDNLITGKLHWLHPEYLLSDVEKGLSIYGKDLIIQREQFYLDEEISVESSVIQIKMFMRSGIKMEDIPHIVQFPKGKYALLVIKGREPMCLKCRIIGHKRIHCLTKKCINCSKFHAENYKCQKLLYSNVLKENFAPKTDNVFSPNSITLEESTVITETQINSTEIIKIGIAQQLSSMVEENQSTINPLEESSVETENFENTETKDVFQKISKRNYSKMSGNSSQKNDRNKPKKSNSLASFSKTLTKDSTSVLKDPGNKTETNLFSVLEDFSV